MNLRSNIRFLRKQAGLTQAELAVRLGLNRPVVGAYEEGRAEPKLQNLQMIAQFFNRSIDDLLNKDLASGEKAKDITGRNLRILSIVVDAANEKERATLVPLKAAAGYLNGFGDVDYITALQSFNMPFPEMPPDQSYRIFQIEGDSMLPLLPGTYIITRYEQDWTQIKPAARYILLTKRDGIVFKRVKPVENGKRLELSSDNPDFKSYQIDMDDVLEIWKAFGAVHFNLDLLSEKPEIVQLRLAQSLERLEGRIKNLEEN